MGVKKNNNKQLDNSKLLFIQALKIFIHAYS